MYCCTISSVRLAELTANYPIHTKCTFRSDFVCAPCRYFRTRPHYHDFLFA